MEELDQLESLLQDMLAGNPVDENDIHNAIFLVEQLKQKQKFSLIKRENYPNPNNLRLVGLENE